MERVAQFLKEAETYYLATVEGDQPKGKTFWNRTHFWREARQSMLDAYPSITMEK